MTKLERDSRLRGNSCLKINEIFYSIQGESSLMGRPCVFVRLTYCNLRCSYCDTEYAFYEGTELSLDEIIDEVEKYKCNLVEITGGEPLIQENVHNLMKELCDKDYLVMIETAGSLPIQTIDKRVKVIMDLKTPSSGMADKNLYENIQFLKRIDEVKFVIGTREDYEWSKKKMNEYDLLNKVTVLMGPVFERVNNIDLASWILEDRLNVRFQLQMHKYIWDPLARGV
jgi:7-carboxy-7-deazaguanine synthase